jgi:uncharacterized protein YbaR (Trm112 family)
MAHLWVKNGSELWAVLPLEADAFVLTTNPPKPVRNLPGASESVSKVVLLRQLRAEEISWVLVSGCERDVRINGVQLALGVQRVADRDEINIEGLGTLYFSTESLARIEPFPGAAQDLYCPRCKQAIESGSAAVKCPQCRTWYHQTEELPCWSYSETCALCPQTTDLKAGFRWTPEEL